MGSLTVTRKHGIITNRHFYRAPDVIRVYSRSMTQSEDTNRWSHLPESVSLEDTITMKAIDPGKDGTPDVDLERYWAAQEQG
ncbi:hypothetical protein CFP75_39395 [Amycolatopsis alba DSM 44262]|uniref:Uncharacterized protein n=4 Tax=Amycolatopsis TaxID=1813 RepID=A0A229R946_AMYAL|nr:hypothetical protein CFP75_39395 [Amycolatopsis alba DSM 44262]